MVGLIGLTERSLEEQVLKSPFTFCKEMEIQQDLLRVLSPGTPVGT